MIPRLAMCFSVFFVGLFFLRLGFIGRRVGEPLDGWREKFNKAGNRLICRLVFWFGNVKLVTHKYQKTDVDYSEYLGPEWRSLQLQGKRLSTIVSNHVSFLELLGFVLVDPICCFVADAKL